MNVFQKLYNHIFMHMPGNFDGDGKRATFSDGADTYEVTYQNSQPVSIRHANSPEPMRPHDTTAPWARR